MKACDQVVNLEDQSKTSKQRRKEDKTKRKIKGALRRLVKLEKKKLESKSNFWFEVYSLNKLSGF